MEVKAVLIPKMASKYKLLTVVHNCNDYHALKSSEGYDSWLIEMNRTCAATSCCLVQSRNGDYDRYNGRLHQSTLIYRDHVGLW